MFSRWSTKSIRTGGTRLVRPGSAIAKRRCKMREDFDKFQAPTASSFPSNVAASVVKSDIV